jgi:hypothetical protein
MSPDLGSYSPLTSIGRSLSGIRRDLAFTDAPHSPAALKIKAGFLSLCTAGAIVASAAAQAAAPTVSFDNLPTGVSVEGLGAVHPASTSIPFVRAERLSSSRQAQGHRASTRLPTRIRRTIIVFGTRMTIKSM